MTPRLNKTAMMVAQALTCLSIAGCGGSSAPQADAVADGSDQPSQVQQDARKSAAAAAPAPVTAQQIEAETAVLGGGANIQTASNASGGQIVGHLSAVGAYAKVTVDGGSGGVATLRIRVANGNPAASRLSLYVNGVRQQQLTIAPTGNWNNFVDLNTAAVTLAAGKNVVSLQHDANDLNSADIDRISVLPQATNASYEAEAGAIGGGANIQSAVNASGGQIVGHLLNVGAFAKVTVAGGTGGVATLRIRAANGTAAASRLSLYVNGVRQQQLTFAPTGNWSTFVDLTSAAVTLVAGNNSVSLQHDAGDVSSVDVDLISVVRGSPAPAPAPAPAPGWQPPLTAASPASAPSGTAAEPSSTAPASTQATATSGHVYFYCYLYYC